MDQTRTADLKPSPPKLVEQIHLGFLANHEGLADELRWRARGYPASTLFRSILLTAARVIDNYRLEADDLAALSQEAKG